jgi:hypothetical protein
VTDHPPQTKPTARPLAIVFLTTWALLVVVAGPDQVIDPFLRHDDFPALLLQPQGYYEKTLSEGRWFNYLWHLRPVQTPAWLNFQLCLAGWAGFSAALSLHTLGGSTLRYPILAAALVALSPQAALISLWFNTLVPGVWVIASYALLTLWLTERTSRHLLLIFVPLALQIYTTYPFLILAVCLLRRDQARSPGHLVRLILVFALAFALGLLIIYSANYVAHGVFGVSLADWRAPNPLRTTADLAANVNTIARFGILVFQATGFGDLRLAGLISGLFAAALAVVARKEPLFAIYVLAGLTVGLGLLCLHMLLEGVLVPFRSTIFVWTFLAVTLARAAYLSRDEAPWQGSLGRIALLSLTGIAALQVQMHYSALGTWQASTRQLAGVIPKGTETVYVYGNYQSQPGAAEARVQHPRGLRLRLSTLTGAHTILCDETPEACTTVTSPFDLSTPVEEASIEAQGSITYIRLPDASEEP